MRHQINVCRSSTTGGTREFFHLCRVHVALPQPVQIVFPSLDPSKSSSRCRRSETAVSTNTACFACRSSNSMAIRGLTSYRNSKNPYRHNLQRSDIRSRAKQPLKPASPQHPLKAPVPPPPTPYHAQNPEQWQPQSHPISKVDVRLSELSFIILLVRIVQSLFYFFRRSANVECN